MNQSKPFPATPGADLRQADEPRDGYGAGFLVYRIASDFHALCCLSGNEAARQEIAEIVNTQFERKSRG